MLSESQPVPLPIAVWLAITSALAMFFGYENNGLALVVMLVLAGLGLIFWLSRSREIPRWLEYSFLVAVTGSVATLLLTRNTYYTAIAVAWAWFGWIVVACAATWLRDTALLGRLAWWLIVTQVVLAGSGLYTFLVHGERAYGFVGNANGLGGALVWSVCLALVFLTDRRWRWWAATALCIIGGAWLVTISLTAFLSSIIPLMIIGWRLRRDIAWRPILAIGGSLIVIVAAVWFVWRPARLVSLMTGGHAATSVSQRLEFDRVAIRMWKDKPWFGWGLGTYRQTFPRYTRQYLEQPLYAHDLYLQILAETGMVGGLLWLGLVVVIGWRGWRIVQADAGTSQGLISLGLFAGWLAFSLHAIIDFSWYFLAGQVWWLIGSGYFLGRWTTVRGWWQGRSKGAVAGTVGLLLLVFSASAWHYRVLGLAERGRTAAAHDDDTAAITQLRGAVMAEWNPEDVATLSQRLWLRRRSRDFAEAERVNRTALGRDPDNYYLWDSLGQILVAEHAYAQAVDASANAYRLDPRFHPQFVYNYVRGLKALGRSDEAQAVLKQAIRAYEQGAAVNPLVAQQLPGLRALEHEINGPDS